ncbi:WcaI family glycosyltransferase [Citromicrobium bathyomarinum]|uniref:WcaI family glycosyltransferase n=1 Tax=Citromicrobium bathyomarinum TaxID=72174 RepID=UPI003159FDF2
MKVLFLTLNYAPEEIGIGPYSTGTAQWLAKAGHEVVVVAGKPYYPRWDVPQEWRGRLYRKSVEQGVSITRCMHYVPAEPSGSKRLAHHATFANAALMPMMKAALSGKRRPDVVLTVAPSMIAASTAILAARTARVPLWLHIQDFEVEAALATGLIDRDSTIAYRAVGVERAVLRAADRVSSISPAMVAKLIEKGVAPENTYEFRNWANIENIVPLTGLSPFQDEWSIGSRKVALYSGNIANKQGIEIVVDAARLLSHRDDLVFAVCGNGPNRANLERQASGLDNIQFHDLQPRGRLSDLLGLASVHLLPQIAGAADLVLPSKLTNMLASGKPTVATAEPGTGLALEVEGAGIVTPPGDTGAFVAAIEQVLDSADLAAKLGATAREKAVETWERSKILSAFEQQLVALSKA